LLQRHGNDQQISDIDPLRQTAKSLKKHHPFVIQGWFALPQHLHHVIDLLPVDSGLQAGQSWLGISDKRLAALGFYHMVR
jgi:REP element-mobilizing transposase RayT